MADTASFERQLAEIARQHGFSTDAARSLFDSIRIGGGRMAQFSHPELGGMGQWSAGGMLMIGDMFNNRLKGQVDQLCQALSDLAAQFPAGSGQGGGGFGGQWWPEGLGQPSSSGAQNDMGYAFFPQTRRLAIRRNGEVTLYDTGDHMISGVSQQQGGGYDLSFATAYGPVDLGSLPVVRGGGDQPQTAGQGQSQPGQVQQAQVQQGNDQGQFQSPPAVSTDPAAFHSAALDTGASTSPAVSGDRAQAPTGPDLTAAAPVAAAMAAPSRDPDDVFAKLERLAELHRKGILSDDEFQTKKAELLARI